MSYILPRQHDAHWTMPAMLPGQNVRHVNKGPPQTFSGHFFRKNYRLKIVKLRERKK